MSENDVPNRPRLPSPLDEPEAPAPEADEAPAPVADPSRRFSIKFLMLLTLVVAIATAGYSGMNHGGERRIGALFFTLVSPLALLIVVSLVQRWLRRRR